MQPKILVPTATNIIVTILQFCASPCYNLSYGWEGILTRFVAEMNEEHKIDLHVYHWKYLKYQWKYLKISKLKRYSFGTL